MISGKDERTEHGEPTSRARRCAKRGRRRGEMAGRYTAEELADLRKVCARGEPGGLADFARRWGRSYDGVRSKAWRDGLTGRFMEEGRYTAEELADLRKVCERGEPGGLRDFAERWGRSRGSVRMKAMTSGLTGRFMEVRQEAARRKAESRDRS